MAPLLTVGIPAFDRWEKVARVLETLAAQRTDAGFEVILIDDCHPEPLAERVRERFPQVVAQRNATNRGPAYTRNRILELASAPYVAFLDADCIVPDHWIERIRPHLDPGTVLSGRVVRPDGSVEWGPRRSTWLGVSLPCRVDEANVASSNNMVVPTALAFRAGGFNEGLGIYFEDSFFTLMLRRAGARVRYLADAAVVHDHHSAGNPRRLYLQSRNTVWAMHHYYHGRPLVQAGCAAALTVNYLVQAATALARGRPAASAGLLRGTVAGMAAARRNPWRDAWLSQSHAAPPP